MNTSGVRIQAWALALAALAWVPGCHAPTPMQARAAAEMGCPSERLIMEELTEAEARAKHGLVLEGQTLRVTGCGRRVFYIYTCPGGNRMDPSCGYVSSDKLKQQLLMQRVTFDMHCPAEQLRFMPVDYRVLGVEGCGYRMAYAWNCPHDPLIFSRQCAWVADLRQMPYPQPIPQPR